MKLDLRQTKHGWTLFDPGDAWVGRALVRMGEYSWAEVAMLCALASRAPGAVVVDAGAHIGTLTVPLAASIAGGGGVVHSFEPQRLMFQVLCANLALNGIENVYAHCEALGACAGEAFVQPVYPNTGGVSLKGAVDGDRVPMRTVDSLALDRLDLLRADVEDMEIDVLCGARETIRRCRPGMYLECNGLVDTMLDELESMDYRAWWHFPHLLVEERNGKPIQVVSHNLLCLPSHIALDGDLEPARRGDEALKAAHKEWQRNRERYFAEHPDAVRPEATCAS